MLASVLFASSIFAAEGHGFMTLPEIRGKTGPFQYELQSLGAIGPGGDLTICGKNAGGGNHAGMLTRVDADPVGEMGAPGSEFTFKAKITAHHMGHMIVRVCPYIADSSFTYADLANCIRLADPQGSATWPLTAETGDKEWTAVLPTKAQLEGLNSPNGVFTVQWRWNTANSCTQAGEPNDQLTGACSESQCCSEVFTNCADVAFDGIASTIPTSPLPAPTPPAPPATGGGGGAASGPHCVPQPLFASSLVNWCKTNMACGEASNDQCDCSCTGGGDAGGATPEPESEPETAHVVTANADAAAVLSGLTSFCQANKEYLCSTTTTDDYLANLCECTPATAAEPAPDPAPDPAPEPEAQPEPAADTGADASDPAGDLSYSECKTKCSAACAGDVERNQGFDYWNGGRLIWCQCKDGTEPTWAGCGCTAPIAGDGCPASVHVSLAATKFADSVRKKVEIRAHGDLSLDQ